MTISIIGAGPGGLTCARILQQHGIPVKVYDRDPHPGARNQGGTLDLHVDDGQLALREAGLLDEFFALARPEGQEMRKLDPAGRLLAHHVPAEGELFKPEIDRGQLRGLLLDSLKPDTVHWGRALDRVEAPGLLRFTDGATVETDLIIGADGAWSRVRPAVSAAVPEYTGITFLEAWFDDVRTAHPEIAELVGQGSAMAADGERCLFAQRNSGDHIRVYIIQRMPADWVSGGGTSEIRARLLDAFSGWSPSLLRMITDNDGPYVDRPLYALPVPHTWKHKPWVTLLGDAAHLMPPLGVGVNLAMLDACELSLALAGSASSSEAVGVYEATMLPRSAEIARRLENGAQGLLDVD
ncbi:FAD-dependent oxidoreductase [Amycolatopsis keratiniphila]|uniref:Flavin-dependent monooxygenase n=1 Tax=Amycolatopsis keratiniphila subsp. keratiniphila TaxID=227715 RepID=A0A1W2LL95_9PSEU|nr:NAD(P)/FAD-dependent oxidoreductase [Amycolatopsis keratiniphila]ONF63520.1 FAD-dependent oxidoreductase [Amycolatopsis keratiniphila subsp. keratiniphila]